jgi:hypothetical protein
VTWETKSRMDDNTKVDLTVEGRDVVTMWTQVLQCDSVLIITSSGPQCTRHGQGIRSFRPTVTLLIMSRALQESCLLLLQRSKHNQSITIHLSFGLSHSVSTVNRK